MSTLPAVHSLPKQPANLAKILQTPNKYFMLGKNDYICLNIEKNYAGTGKNSHLRFQEHPSSGT